MTFTREQIQAQANLQNAIEDHVAAFRPRPEGDGAEVLTDWVLIACTISYDDDGQRAGYHMGYLHGEMPEHVVVGMCEVGKNIAQGTYVRAEDA